MKLKYILPILFISIFAVSCSSDDNDSETNEIEGLTLVQELTNATHTIELYNATGEFLTGYNVISIRVKDNVSNAYVENASITWNPVMQMTNMSHSCPKSAIVKDSGKTTVYEGFIIYQMANLDGSGWSLTVDYTINGEAYSATDTITVMQAEKQNVTSFTGSDNTRYIIALLQPQTPKIAINDMVVGLYKMESMMSFPVVEDYTITLDPRMPGMGNHSSPNNTDLTYNSINGLYYGDLSLTMTGYWVLNLKLLNTQNEVLKGEDVTTDNIQSSLYLELEF
ncbi:hypothetical protein EV196_101395 [Mariniflexile fucanivorans]|uniref:YtkA-like protein n=1 Tax=Mariniflexile fucanivorans TaxID=264023 RepID=A0A4R1RRB5_9FLAO|nr:hypothetical protein [Mariniflexile fucanivorans]TCL68968.1 hypothetical protein EV196_101395 [Mariniflexile fucanivorans]